MKWTTRAGGMDDVPFLRAMLLEAAFWRPGTPRPTLEQGLAHPELSKLLAGWGRKGDFAVIASLETGESIGAAWYRYWTDDNHSYGYVSPAIPELAIGVQDSWRGKGVGKSLIAALQQYSIEQGVPALSLSVEVDNPARRLYDSTGFHAHEQLGNAVTMIWEPGMMAIPK